jgi:mono/diheme cytochrome c family protein
MLKLLSTGALLLGLAATAACDKSEASSSDHTPKSADRVARGNYLVTAMACGDCHTPFKMGPKGPEPDMDRYLSGHPEQAKVGPAPKAQGPWIVQSFATNTAHAGPWGISYTANLTPDVNTGLGIWTEDMFLRAIREGKHMGQSRPIMPPMPWPAFRNLNDEDLKSIFAYLRTIKPIVNHVPDYQPPAEPEDK